MSDLFSLDAPDPLLPLYPFNEPGQPVVLYEGAIRGLASVDVTGSVELSCTPRPGIEWHVEPEAPPQFANQPAVTLALRRWDGDVLLPGVPRGIGGGWSNGTVAGRADVPLNRIVAHWFNLPRWHGLLRLTAQTQDGGQRWWPGRWIAEVGNWRIILDARHDHQRVWADLHKTDVYVMTHVMELRRLDGEDFTAGEVEPLLAALHVVVSFALGRWAAPMLPVGQDSGGRVVWEDWRPGFCDPAQAISGGWWYQYDQKALAELLECAVPLLADPASRDALRLQMMLAIMGVADRGFVEQRVMNCAAGLEHLMWQVLVLGGLLTQDQYLGRSRYQGQRLRAHDLLRMVLTDAAISVGIDPVLLPVAARFASEKSKHQGRKLDGADVVTQIRNRLVHPKAAQESVYRLDGLVAEVWLLARHYLVLLILHSIGYRGPYRDLTRTTGWAGDVAAVPWASQPGPSASAS
ncbi:MAG: hypothetical protein ACLQFR_08405 [Streptosporangiaceae bacterium]